MKETDISALSVEEKRRLLAKLLAEKKSKPVQYPTSFGQKRLWFLDQMTLGERNTYNMPFLLRFNSEELEIPILERTLQEIVQRHQPLRTSVRLEEAQVVQVVHQSMPLSFSVVDLRTVSEKEREQRVQEISSTEAHRSFDLKQGPLLRVHLIIIGSEQFALLLVMHHIVSDGWSMRLLLQEIKELYGALITGKSSPLPALPVQYGDYAIWQQEWMQSEQMKNQLAYWREKLKGAPGMLELSTDYPRPDAQTFEGDQVRFSIPQPFADQLRTFCLQQKTTMYTLLLAAFQVLMHRYSNADDILVGTPVSGRTQLETESLIGLFANTLVVRTNCSDNISFSKLLGSVHQSVLEGLEHQDLPFDRLVEELQPVRDVRYNPLFQVMFSYQEGRAVESDSLLKIQADPFWTKVAKFDLSLDIEETVASMTGVLEYNTDLFTASTVQRMVDHYLNLLLGVLAEPEKGIDDLNLLTEEERDLILSKWNEKTVPFQTDVYLHQIFEENAIRTPDKIALIDQHQRLTYAELNRRANQLAHHLRGLRVGPEVMVGLLMDRSADVVIALLAIWKAGGAYVPFDPTYPRERLALLLKTVRPHVMLVQESYRDLASSMNVSIMTLDLDQDLAHQPGSNLECVTKPDALAYIIFTSGTTGLPKAVMIEHQMLANLAAVAKREYGLSEQDVVLNMASISFDVFIGDMLKMIVSNGQIVICPTDIRLQIPALCDLLVRENITLMECTPGLAVPLMDYIHRKNLPIGVLRMLMVSSDYFQAVDYKTMLERFGGTVRILNSYGITETTIDSSYFESKLDEVERITGYVPIGSPMANMKFYILNEQMSPQPIGVAGELYIGGPSVARGYYGRPDLTNERFIANPFVSSERLYKTGDLVRWNERGQVVFIGRKDHQIKIRGFRIELGEIESVIGTHPLVRDVVVLARDSKNGDRFLVAFLVVEGDKAIAIEKVKIDIRQLLPTHAVPAVFQCVDHLPLTDNGKIDRRVLSEWSIEGEVLQSSQYAPPRESVEIGLQKIWEDLFNISPIGIYDNFFEIGGHSLMLVHLFDCVTRHFDIDIPLTVMFQNPTIEALAVLIRHHVGNRDIQTTETAIVPLQTKGTKNPIYLVHPVGGYLFTYAALVRNLEQLDQERPIYGFQITSNEQDQSLEEIASDYVHELRKFQPEGPYHIVGYSFGGNLAYEIANQLKMQGVLVGLLGLIDSHVEEYVEQPDDFTLLMDFVERFNLSLEEVEKMRGLDPEGRLKFTLELGIRANYFTPDRTVERVRPLVRAFVKNNRALKTYRLTPYAGVITLFRAMDAEQDASIDWIDLTKASLEVVPVPGHHYTMIKPPHVRELAQRMLDRVNAAEKGTVLNEI